MNQSSNNIPESPIMVSYPVFKKAIHDLAAHRGGVPERITRESILDASDNARKLVISAFKRFGLIDAEGNSSITLRRMASCNSEDIWKKHLSDLLASDYPAELEILRSGDMDLLPRAIAADYSQSRQRKALSFFVMAAADAGILDADQHPITRSRIRSKTITNTATKEKLPKMKRAESANDTQSNQDTWLVTLGGVNHQVGTILIPRAVGLDKPELIQALLEVARLYDAQAKGGDSS